MSQNENTNEQQWVLLVLLLQEIAIEKYGTGYQTIIAEETGLQKSNISRIFSLKYAPSLKNFLLISKAIKINFFFEDKESKVELNVMFERAMENLGRRPNKLPKN